jgi:hypothetical protein
MERKAKPIMLTLLIITCLMIPNYVQASTLANTSTETTASVSELSVVLILGLMVILTVFVALVRLRMDSKALKFGNTSNRI